MPALAGQQAGDGPGDCDRAAGGTGPRRDEHRAYPAEPVQRVVPVAVMRRNARPDESTGGITCQGCERVVGQWVAVDAGQAADCAGELSLSAAARIERRSDRVNPGSDMGSSS